MVRESTISDPAFGDNHYDKFTNYSDRNELTESERFKNTAPPAETSPDPNYDRRYWYDTAGNPVKHKRGTDPNTPATFNALNLCTSIDDPDPPHDPVETFSYDDDHNLTEGRLYKYTYDAENRLIEMELNKDPNDLTGDDKKYVHAYDYMGRRVRTRVYTWDTQQEQWETTPDEDRRFMYHGRQRILTLTGSAADDELFKFVWGPEPMKGGGRLGHLLAIGDDPNGVDYVCFHDGAGNLGQVAKRSDGTLVAKYDFNGRTRAAIGDCDDPNSLDDCEDCGPCFLEYRLGGDNSFVPVCVCGPSQSQPNCTGTTCGGFCPGEDPGGSLCGGVDCAQPFLPFPSQGSPTLLNPITKIKCILKCAWKCRGCWKAYTCLGKCGNYCDHIDRQTECYNECTDRKIKPGLKGNPYNCDVYCQTAWHTGTGEEWKKCMRNCADNCEHDLAECADCLKCWIKCAYKTLVP